MGEKERKTSQDKKSELRALTQSASPQREWAGADKGEIAQRRFNHSGGGEWESQLRQRVSRACWAEKTTRWGGVGADGTHQHHAVGFASGCHAATLPSSPAKIRDRGGTEGDWGDAIVLQHKEHFNQSVSACVFQFQSLRHTWMWCCVHKQLRLLSTYLLDC